MAKWYSEKRRGMRGAPRMDDPLHSGVCLWITADTPAELDEVYAAARARNANPHANMPSDSALYKRGQAMATPAIPELHGTITQPLKPKNSMEYRTKCNAILTVPDSHEPLLRKGLGTLPLPEAYHTVVRRQLRLQVFEDIWHAEVWQSSQQFDRYKEELRLHQAEVERRAAMRRDFRKPQPVLPELVRPQQPELLARFSTDRPDIEAIRKYHESKVRAALVELLVGGHWIDDPEREYEDDEEVGEEIERLNYEFSKISLGRQSHLRFSSTPGEPKRFGPRPSGNTGRGAYLANPLVDEYILAEPERRRELRRQNAALDYLLRQAGVGLDD